MGTKVTLTIPDYIYQQAEIVARSEQRPVAELFTEALAQLFPAVHINPRRTQMEQEQSAFRDQHTKLLAQYPGDYVAIYQGKAIDHDADQLALVGRIDEQYPDEIILIKRLTDEPEHILHMRSPRLVSE